MDRADSTTRRAAADGPRGCWRVGVLGACTVTTDGSGGILERMRPLALLTPALTCALLLTSCLGEGGDVPGAGGEGAQPGDVAAGQSEPTLTAPEPTGEQLDHDEMREALDTHASGSITDTDDYWEHMRDLSTELQRLSVDPNECKPYVTASALPVPSAALAAFAEDEDEHTAVYTFPDTDAAQTYVDNEQRAAGQCGEHTVTRELEGGDIEVTTEISELEILSGADSHLALQQEISQDGSSEHLIGVVLRHEAQVTAVSRPVEAPLGENEAEEVVVELEAAAATILEDLTGADLDPPEPQPEDDEDDAE